MKQQWKGVQQQQEKEQGIIYELFQQNDGIS